MSQEPVSDVVFLFDVDNTLLDNDRVTEDLRVDLKRELGPEAEARYWDIFEKLRAELGYADYLGALQRFRNQQSSDTRFARISSYLLNYPFADRLYPKALEVLRHLGALAPTAILSDGDVVFQPYKIQRSGIEAAVGGRVLIYIHKELELAGMRKFYPAKHYVLVDDKMRILTACKRELGTQLTTVFVAQGHYAHDEQSVASFPPADLRVDAVGDLLSYELPDFLPGSKR